MTTSTYERIIQAAAESRGQKIQARTDRPSQRRWAEEPGTAPIAVVRAPVMELRATEGDDGMLHFRGFASVYDAGYEMWDMFGPYTEQVSSGAGAVSLAREDLDVPLVLQHESMRRIARTVNDTLTLSEDTVEVPDRGPVSGLLTDAPALDPTDVDVAYIAPKLRAGLIDEMSFKFRIMRGEWSPNWDEYHIKEYDIHRGDVAIVGYGANPHTQGAGLRASQVPALSDLTDEALRKLENDLHAERKARGVEPPAAPAAPAAELGYAALAAIDDMYR